MVIRLSFKIVMILVIFTLLGHGRFLWPLYSLSTSALLFQPLCICTPSIDYFLPIVSTIVHMYKIDHHIWHTNIMFPTSLSDPPCCQLTHAYLCTSIARKYPLILFTSMMVGALHVNFVHIILFM